MMPPQCPICHKVITRATSADKGVAFLPFCSERCRLVDLNAWLDADYRIDAPLNADDHEDLPMD